MIRRDVDSIRRLNASDRLALLCVRRLRDRLSRIGINAKVKHEHLDDAPSHSGIHGYRHMNHEFVHAIIASCLVCSVKAK